MMLIYAQDCLRHNYGGIWSAGLPWALLDAALVIRSPVGSLLHVSEQCKLNWTERTGRAWDNRDDPAAKTLKCPACPQTNVIPWTTCGLSEAERGTRCVHKLRKTMSNCPH
jgi:hypothetical protein